MMKKTIFLLFWLLTATLGGLHAQSLASFREHLARPAADGSAVRVVEADGAEAVVAQLAAKTPPTRLQGYRVCIFFDNGQEARAGAVAARNLFEEHFPDIKLYMVYENPYFRVTVGNCLTIEEAVILKGRLASVFPKAFPKSEELLVTDLLE